MATPPPSASADGGTSANPAKAVRLSSSPADFAPFQPPISMGGLSSYDAAAFARQHRILLLTHQASQVNVDISFGVLPFEEEAPARSVIRFTGSTYVRTPTAEDMIVLKAIAHRAKDMHDIRTIVEACPNLDVGRIKRWVQDFGDFLEMPELWDDLAPLLPPS